MTRVFAKPGNRFCVMRGLDPAPCANTPYILLKEYVELTCVAVL